MTTTLKTNVGRTTGSPEARRLRGADHIPAVIYGAGMQPVSITVERRDLRIALSGPAGTNTILELQVADKTYPAIVKDMQRDPVKRNVSHVDFMQIDLSKEIVIDVTNMNMNTIIRMEDITLPTGVTAVSDPDLVVVTVLVTSTQSDKPAVAAGEAAAGEAPAAGAPAAGDKPAAS